MKKTPRERTLERVLRAVLASGLNGGNNVRLAFIAAGGRALDAEAHAQADASERAVNEATALLAGGPGDGPAWDFGPYGNAGSLVKRDGVPFARVTVVNHHLAPADVIASLALAVGAGPSDVIADIRRAAQVGMAAGCGDAHGDDDCGYGKALRVVAALVGLEWR